mgnify:CR=1 FL=1
MTTEILEKNPAASHWERADMTKEEWEQAVKFDGIDWGWIVMSIGMAIGAGIVFLPVQIGVTGLLVFLISSLIGYPVMYAFQRLYINTLAASPKNQVYADTISGYLGKNWGFLMGIAYFIMLMDTIMTYATTVNNDSGSFLYSFGITGTNLSGNAFYTLVVMVVLVAIASRGEKILFKLQTIMALTILAALLFMGFSFVPSWNLANIAPLPDAGNLIKQVIIMLPFTMTSILFIQSLSPMVMSYRTHYINKEVAWFKSIRAMNISFIILFIVVVFFAVSFNLGTSREMAVIAKEQNISALAMAAGGMDAATVKILSLILALFAILTSFFSNFLGFCESIRGIVLNVLRRFMDEQKINNRVIDKGVVLFSVLFCWAVVAFNLPVLILLSCLGPLIGIIGCIVPVILVYRLSFLHQYKGPVLWAIVFTGLLLIVSPFLNLLQ